MLPLYAVCSFFAMLLSEMPDKKIIIELLEGALPTVRKLHHEISP